MEVARLEVVAQFEAGSCKKALEGRNGRLTKVALVRRDHGRRDARPLRQLLLTETGFEPGQGEDRGGGGSQLVRLCHDTIVSYPTEAVCSLVG